MKELHRARKCLLMLRDFLNKNFRFKFYIQSKPWLLLNCKTLSFIYKSSLLAQETFLQLTSVLKRSTVSSSFYINITFIQIKKKKLPGFLIAGVKKFWTGAVLEFMKMHQSLQLIFGTKADIIDIGHLFLCLSVFHTSVKKLLEVILWFWKNNMVTIFF